MLGEWNRVRNFKWWIYFCLSESWEIFTALSLWEVERDVVVCEKSYRFPCVYTAEHFLIGGRSFVHNIIHLPVQTERQPIETQQERKYFSHVGITHLLCFPSNVKIELRSSKLSTRFFNFTPVRAFFPSHTANELQAAASDDEIFLSSWLLAGKKDLKKKEKKFSSTTRETLVKNITMIMIDDET